LAQNEPSLIRDVNAAQSQGVDIPGLAQAEATNVSAPAAPEIFAAAQSLAPETLIVKAPDTPNAKAPQAKADASDAEEKISADATTQAPGKGDIHIRELLKLGVTDATLTHEGPQLAALAPQAETITPIATPDMTPGAASTPQASMVATSNVETNGERRSIADDIRLRALERMVVNAARNGTQILSIQLYPPGLGQVVLRLAMDGQRLRLATRASNTEAAETLRNMETDLRSALAGNGLQLTGFDVSEDGTNDDAPRRQQPAEPVIKTRSGGTDESFTVELNA
jgi:flagellar hook-length control protein FliK